MQTEEGVDAIHREIWVCVCVGEDGGGCEMATPLYVSEKQQKAIKVLYENDFDIKDISDLLNLDTVVVVTAIRKMKEVI